MIEGIDLNVIMFRFLIACIVGGIIGFEREMHNRAAGFRTHILVCVGACIISLMEMKMEQEFIKSYQDIGTQISGIVLTRGRLAAQVISGIGFLGAGTIIFSKGSIKGLTTAASLWVVACLGLAIGYGQIDIAIIGVILSFVTLHLLITIQDNFINKKQVYKVEIIYLSKEECLFKVENVFFDNQVKIKSFKNDNDRDKLIYKISVPKNSKISKIVNSIMINDYVVDVKIK